jgi:hypothetical protein
MVQHVAQTSRIGTAPLQLPLVWPVVRANRDSNLVVQQVSEQSPCTTEFGELLEDEPHDRLRLFIGI